MRGDVLVVAARTRDATSVRVELDRVQRADATTRATRVRRRVWADGALLEDAVVVDDRQRLVPVLRTCLDCGEHACHARVELEAG